MKHRPASKDAGFTLSELMLVVAILAILVLIAVTTWQTASIRAQRATCLGNQRILQNAIIEYQVASDGAFPADLTDLAPQVPNSPQCFFCPSDPTDPLEYDPVTGVVTCDRHP